MRCEVGAHTLVCDIVGDLDGWAYHQLTALGYEHVEDGHALQQYINVCLRTLVPKPRRIMKSKEFNCPLAYVDALKLLEKAICCGDALYPFMTKSILNADYQDKMLNDWGFFHFHLSLEKDGKDSRFMARSDTLVIAYVDRYQDDTLYFIQTVAHRQEIWSQQKLVRIVADNWPDAIEKYRIKGVAGLTEKINDHGYSQLRKANANTFVDLGDGRVYCGANYGLTTAGTSVRATIQCQNMIRAAQATERFIQVNADSICRCIDDATGRKTREYCLGLIHPCNRDYIFTVNNGFAFLRIIWTDEGKMTIRVCEDIELINT